MVYAEQLKEFLGEGVPASELRTVALHVVAASVRRLKPAIAEQVWLAREAAAAGEDGSARHLAEARRLKLRYQAALDEYRTLSAGGVVEVDDEEAAD